jgi:hypothetical protein
MRRGVTGGGATGGVATLMPRPGARAPTTRVVDALGNRLPGDKREVAPAAARGPVLISPAKAAFSVLRHPATAAFWFLRHPCSFSSSPRRRGPRVAFVRRNQKGVPAPPGGPALKPLPGTAATVLTARPGHRGRPPAQPRRARIGGRTPDQRQFLRNHSASSSSLISPAASISNMLATSASLPVNAWRFNSRKRSVTIAAIRLLPSTKA